MTPSRVAALFEDARYVYIRFDDFRVEDADLAPAEVVDIVNDFADVYETMRDRYGTGHKAVLVGPKIARLLWMHVRATFQPVYRSTFGAESAGDPVPSPLLEVADA